MFLVYSQAELLQAISKQKRPIDTTYALVPLVDSFYDEDAQSVALAKKYADVCVAVAVGKAQAFDRPSQRRMAEAGVEFFLLAPPQETPVRIEEISPYINATRYLQSLLAVMPSLVVVHPNHIPLLRVTRAFLASFEQLFTFMEPEVKVVGYGVQQEIVQALQVVQNLIQSGEAEAKALLQAGADGLKVRGFAKIYELAFYDQGDLTEINGRLQRSAYLYAAVERGGQRYIQTLRIQKP